jgi:hypothetical protein
MTFKNLVGAGAIAGALGFSALGLAGVANAAPLPAPAPAAVQHAQLAGWGGRGGWHGPGWHGDRGWHGGGWGRPGWGAGWGGPPPPCAFGICV